MAGAKKKELYFVVQKHDATHLHYDFRLELYGVLKSWAIPKGPSMSPKDKRLAMMVEDHDYDYRHFEGVIPSGYGAGTVMVWDEGTYTSPNGTSQADIENQLNEGHLDIVLNGHKLKGGFTLIRTKQSQWLLIKKKDQEATTEDVTLQDRSVLTKRSLQEIREGKKSRASKEKEDPDLKKSPLPHHVTPMLATLVDKPFDRENWIFEVKWDGYRAMAEIENQKVRLYSRKFQSFNALFPEIVEELEQIGLNCLLDGEIVLLDKKGYSSFQLIQNYQRYKEGTLVYYVFDLLYLDHYSLIEIPLLKRKELLEKVIPPNFQFVKYCGHVVEKGISFFKKIAKKGEEGIIAKNGESPYLPGHRGKDWLKIKARRQQETVICGFTEPRGSRKYFGSLILGVYEGKHLVNVGHAGTGFTEQDLEDLHSLFVPLIQKKSPFEKVPKIHEKVTWINPELVAEIHFAEWTHDGQMRQAVFMGLRKDKNPKEVIRE